VLFRKLIQGVEQDFNRLANWFEDKGWRKALFVEALHQRIDTEEGVRKPRVENLAEEPLRRLSTRSRRETELQSQSLFEKSWHFQASWVGFAPKIGFRMRSYGTDLTDEQWALVVSLIPESKAGGRPRRVDVRSVVNAIFYLLCPGCQWRLLLHNLPPRPKVSLLLPALGSGGSMALTNRLLTT
jgi:hypothetical protein